MAKSRLSQDRRVLREKLSVVNRLLRVYSDGTQGLKAKQETALIVQPNLTQEELFLQMRDDMIPMSAAGLDISYIEQDLETEKSNLGADFSARIGDYWRRLLEIRKELQSITSGPSPQRDAPAKIAEARRVIIDLLEAMNVPAKVLRDRLTQELNRHPKEPIETAGQSKRRRRDLRILELAQAHRTKSPAKLLELANADPELTILKNDGLPVTKDVIRNVIKPRANRRKRPPSKNTGQRKSKKF